ncbi:MAG: hypothetical protein ACREHG_04235 [Candidatus Saccharimonadales bacterium]
MITPVKYPITYKTDQPQPLTLALPSGGGFFWKWAVVKNVTPYTIVITGGNDTFASRPTLGPGMANRWAFTGKSGPLRVTFLTTSPTLYLATNAYIVIDYSTRVTGEDVAGSYPTATSPGITVINGQVSADITGPVTVENVTGTILETGNAIDSLYTGSVTLGTDPLIQLLDLTKSYSALRIVLTFAASSTAVPACAAVLGLGAGLFTRTFVGAFGYTQHATGTATVRRYQTIIASANEVGATLYVQLFSTPRVATIANVRIFGFTLNPGISARSDGKMHPIGNRVSTAGVTGTVVNLAPSPSSPLRILLYSLSVSSFATKNAVVQGAINGKVRQLLSTGSKGANTIAWNQGLLLDPAAQLTLGSTTTGAMFAQCTYDLVV